MLLIVRRSPEACGGRRSRSLTRDGSAVWKVDQKKPPAWKQASRCLNGKQSFAGPSCFKLKVPAELPVPAPVGPPGQVLAVSAKLPASKRSGAPRSPVVFISAEGNWSTCSSKPRPFLRCSRKSFAHPVSLKIQTFATLTRVNV